MTALSCSRIRELAPGFVLGALDRAEMAAVREHLRTCPRPHPEIAELGGVVPYLGQSVAPIVPAAGLKAAVMAAVEADLTARREAPQPSPEHVPALTVVGSEPDRKVVGGGVLAALRSRRAASWATRAAAAIVIFGLLGTVVTLRGALDKAQTGADIWGYIGTAGNRSTVLAPVGEGKGAGAAALLPSRNLRVYVSGLEATHGDEVYIVWISVDGDTARSAGWFTVDGSGTGEVVAEDLSPSSSIRIYVCREANRNVARPTGPVVLSGTIVMWSAPVSTPTF
jgi:hypothetical protein